MPIDASTQLAALIRAQLVSIRAPRLEEGRRPPSNAMGSPDKGSEASADVQELIARRVQALRPDDPQRKRKAFRIFLESVLAQQLKVNSVGAPGFDELVGQVMGQMASDPALAQAIDDAAELLLNGARGP